MNKRAFSLIEMSIVLTILALALVGYLSTSEVGSIAGNTGGISLTKQQQQREQFSVIATAVRRYVVENSFYPCPANPQAAPTDTTFGIGDGGAVCAAANIHDGTATGVWGGAVPVRTLGLHPDLAVDPWGRRIMYVVSDTVVTAPIAAGTIRVLAGYDDASDQTDADQIPFIEVNDAEFALLGFGPDGLGAYSQQGGATRLTTAADSDQQLANHFLFDDGGTAGYDERDFDNVLVRFPTIDGTLLEFDDFVCWGKTTTGAGC